ncbi:DSD1 family PLP-dependent enzyme [Natranaerobius thermophilus]|uniref:Alanine racemase domain protein n=1 Tax=Natranaerobius thermophilus (strain ATCC BAA-1301 / DSM 18059 / JW/NM-WN-LF) TaxID=457570 RepID=B2A6H1_NATTJ|nr:DSD1 family PLP-dependent enzyme [Natranaerobius thermophilus]ACB85504.1 alanine racemase domain protein [Natranaerobius thermophilus JW/NM-WN-LF]
MKSELVSGLKLENLPTPALLLDMSNLEYNINLLADFFRDKPCDIRPHMKGHKNLTIAHMQIDRGAIGVTCAKTSEAEVMVNGGIKDILIANQVIESGKINLLAELARRADIKVAVDSYQNCENLSRIAVEHGVTIGVLVEMDIGLGRCGVKSFDEGINLVQEIQKLDNLEFRGVMGYEGPFRDKTQSEKSDMVKESLSRVVQLKRRIEQENIQVEIVSCGSTGTWDITGNYPEITEIQAGTYPLMEVPYLEDGLPFKSALSVLATVISKSHDKLILDCGLKAVTDDQGIPKLMDYDSPIVGINEEHSIVEIDHETEKLEIGDKIRILPAHSCTTVNLYDYYCCLRNNEVVDIWQVHARGMVT